jgi:hypothetical protein
MSQPLFGLIWFNFFKIIGLFADLGFWVLLQPVLARGKLFFYFFGPNSSNIIEYRRRSSKFIVADGMTNAPATHDP